MAATFADHFGTADGVGPQPWMQHRHVAHAEADSVAKTYGVTGGAAKDEPLQAVTVRWTNRSPLPQQLYGMVSHGGCSVDLQARSRGYITQRHAFTVGSGAPAAAVEVSRFGGGADIGVGGLLGVGTGFGIHRVRHHAYTMPLLPQLTGWATVQPGESVTATVQTRFVSEFWESTPIDRGDSNTSSTILSGDLRLDLFAVPLIGPPAARLTPQIVAVETAIEVAKPVTVTRPAAVKPGDVLVAVAANQMGVGSDITAPTGWDTLVATDDRIQGFGDTHLRVFTRVASIGEPPSYTFTTGFMAEEIVTLLVVRDAQRPEGDLDTTGWASATASRTYDPRTDIHDAPSINRPGQMLICMSFFAHTLLQPGGTTQTVPDGMTEAADIGGRSCSLAVAWLADPPTPTGERRFVPSKKPVFAGRSVCATILVPGAETP